MSYRFNVEELNGVLVAYMICYFSFEFLVFVD